MSIQPVETTFLMDFRIADHFGKDAILDTYKRASKEWIKDVRYFTELVIALNRLCWYHYEQNNHELGMVYHDLYYEARDKALDTYKGDEFQFFFDMTD